LHRREIAAPVALYEGGGREFVQRMVRGLRGHAPAPQAQDMEDRSLQKIGMSFHSPLTFLLATVTHCGWYRKPCTQSSASRRWASPSSLARSAGRCAFLMRS